MKLLNDEKCFYCETPLVKGTHEYCPPNGKTIDHIIPKSRAGAKFYSHLCVYACRSCNHSRMNYYLWEFIEVIVKKMKQNKDLGSIPFQALPIVLKNVTRLQEWLSIYVKAKPYKKAITGK